MTNFSRSITRQYQRTFCLSGKSKKTLIRSKCTSHKNGIEVHVDISGSRTPPSLGRSMYGLHILKNRSHTSKASIVESKVQLTEKVKLFVSNLTKNYIYTGTAVTTIREGNAKENVTKELKQFCHLERVSIITSPPYAPESNVILERFVVERWKRACIILLYCSLSKYFWPEAFQYASWLQNRLQCSRVKSQVHLLI